MNDVDRVLTAIHDRLPPSTDWKTPAGYPALGLCVLDAVFSMGVRYSSVEKVLTRYRSLRAESGADADTDTSVDLLAVIEDAGGGAHFAELINNHHRTSTRSGILKAEAVRLEASQLVEAGVIDVSDLPVSPEALKALSSRWGGVTGQRSLISWHYFLMLTRRPGIKADRMIRRFLANALGRPGASSVSIVEATDLLTASAEELGTDSRTLDHAVWQYQRGR